MQAQTAEPTKAPSAAASQPASGGHRLDPQCDVRDPFAAPARPDLNALSCGIPGSTLFLSASFWSYRVNQLKRVEITGNAMRNEYTVCVGDDCQMVIGQLRDAGERAAASLGGNLPEIIGLLFNKLPRCAPVVGDNPATVDQDSKWGYAIAQNAVLHAYAGSLGTLRAGNRVDVKYKAGGASTFVILWVDANKPSISLTMPPPAEAGGPCQ